MFCITIIQIKTKYVYPKNLHNLAAEVDVTEVNEVITVNEVYYFLQRSSRVVSPGLDGFRFNHFRQIVSKSADNPTKHKVLQLLTWLCNAFMQGKLPVSMIAFLAEAEIFPLEKKSGGIRPIMMVNSVRKVAAANLTDLFKDYNQEVFN